MLENFTYLQQTLVDLYRRRNHHDSLTLIAALFGVLEGKKLAPDLAVYEQQVKAVRDAVSNETWADLVLVFKFIKDAKQRKELLSEASHAAGALPLIESASEDKKNDEDNDRQFRGSGVRGFINVITRTTQLAPPSTLKATKRTRAAAPSVATAAEVESSDSPVAHEQLPVQPVVDAAVPVSEVVGSPPDPISSQEIEVPETVPAPVGVSSDEPDPMVRESPLPEVGAPASDVIMPSGVVTEDPIAALRSLGFHRKVVSLMIEAAGPDLALEVGRWLVTLRNAYAKAYKQRKYPERPLDDPLVLKRCHRVAHDAMRWMFAFAWERYKMTACSEYRLYSVFVALGLPFPKTGETGETDKNLFYILQGATVAVGASLPILKAEDLA